MASSDHLYLPSFKQLIEDIGIDKREAALLLKVHRTTVERWISGEATPPYSAIALLKIMSGDLGCIPGAGEVWKGWTLRSGVLSEPGACHAQHQHTPGTIKAWWWVAQNLQHLRSEENHRNRTIAESDNIASIFPLESPYHDLTEAVYKKLEASSPVV
ncbi:MAG: hypothetical protein B6D76_17685 [gamma proteobacterium symbiont of Stewartia floridana]|nr:MAG: hypothetical protein B6D76_17685 [gamma proteobacterium symbiont of Stewartia floridana]